MPSWVQIVILHNAMLHLRAPAVFSAPSATPLEASTNSAMFLN